MKDEYDFAGVDVILYGIVCLALIMLRALEIIDISWWFVTAPIWIPFALAYIILAVILMWTLIESKVRKNGKQ